MVGNEVGSEQAAEVVDVVELAGGALAVHYGNLSCSTPVADPAFDRQRPGRNGRPVIGKGDNGNLPRVPQLVNHRDLAGGAALVNQR